MRVVIFGATGMVGRGVLNEALRDDHVTHVLTIGREATGLQNPKLQEIVRVDVDSLSDLTDELSRMDACFYCLGVSSVGMKEPAYKKITYDLTLSVAETLAKANPEMTFIYVSGAGTDSSGKGRLMWARVKGATENALLRMPFHAYMFRPGVIIPSQGIKSKTKFYNWAYNVVRPFMPLLKKVSPNMVTSNENVGRAMIHVARKGVSSTILETKDINALAAM